MQIAAINRKLLGVKILVAEDVEMNQHLIRHILETGGAQVVIARNGTEALEKVKKQNFDCVLMDVQMPEMDGIQCTISIRKLENANLASIPIIALTANCTPDDLVKYENAGMDDYLSKPVGESHLIATILSNLEDRQNKTKSDSLIENRLYDLGMIRSVSGGDASFIKKMIVLFIDTVPVNVRELVDATERQNWELVSKMAHKLKSTIDSMGIRSLHDQIRTVESNAKNKECLDLLPMMVKEVESVVKICIQQLHNEIR